MWVSEEVSGSAPTPWRECLDVRRLLATLVHHRDLALHLIRRTVTSRYQGSFLGVGWAVLQPLLMLAVYTYVFGVVFQSRWHPASTSRVEFALALFAGMIPFGLLAETANNAPGVIVGHASYVKRVVFPLEVLPVVVVGSALVFAAINTVILLVAEACFVRIPPWTAVLLPLVALPCVLLSLAISWLLATVGVFIRDVGAFVGFVTQLLFFVTPILYPASAVPERFRPIVDANPLAALVEAWRGLALGIAPVPWLRCTLVTVAAAVLAIGARAIFMRAKRAFADVV